MGMKFQSFKVTRDKEVEWGLPGIDFNEDESVEYIYDNYRMKIYNFSNGFNRLVGASGANWDGELKGYGNISNKLKVGDCLTYEDEDGEIYRFKISSLPLTGICYTVFKLMVVNN